MSLVSRLVSRAVGPIPSTMHTSWLITGGTGFVGQALIQAILRDDPQASIRVITRDVAHARLMFAAEVDLRDRISAETVSGSHIVVNLAGESVQGLMTEERKARILNSRVETTSALSAAIALLAPNDRPRVLLSASGTGAYGDESDRPITEASQRGSHFFSDVCRAWETAALRAEEHGVRVVLCRLGLILGNGGGAYPKLRAAYRAGVGGTLGSGKQYWPWIHIDDVVQMLLFAAKSEKVSGVMNVSAPNPLPQREFSKVLAKRVHRWSLLPTPAWILRTALSDFSSELLDSRRVLPQVALDAGYQFRYAQLSNALAALPDR